MMALAELLHVGHTSGSLNNENRRRYARKEEGEHGNQRDAETV
jgi:hypothetical protein